MDLNEFLKKVKLPKEGVLMGCYQDYQTGEFILRFLPNVISLPHTQQTLEPVLSEKSEEETKIEDVPEDKI